MSFIGIENVQNLHKFIATQIRQKINVDIELDPKYQGIINKLVERINNKKNKNFDKSVTELNKIAIDTIVPFLVKNIEGQRIDNLARSKPIKEIQEDNTILTENTIDYNGLGDNSIEELQNAGQPSVFSMSHQMFNQGGNLQDSSVYDERIESDKGFFEKTLKNSQTLVPQELGVREMTPQGIYDFKQESQNLVETYDAEESISMRVKEDEEANLVTETDRDKIMISRTNLSTQSRALTREDKMVVLDLYPDANGQGNNGQFANTTGIDNIVCTLERDLELGRPHDVYIEFITMNNLIGLDTNSTQFELFHSFALEILELNVDTYSNLSGFSNRIIIPNEMFGISKEDSTEGVIGDSNSYTLRLKSNFICRLDSKIFNRFTVSLKGLPSNNPSARTLTTMTNATIANRAALPATGLTWTFTDNNPAADTIDCTGGNHNLLPGDSITFTAGVVGSGFVLNRQYFVLTVPNATRITLSLTPGGTQIPQTGFGNDVATSYTSLENQTFDARLQIGLFFRER